MAAVLPESGATTWSAITWGDGSAIQVTTFEYGADVVGRNWTAPAYDSGWAIAPIVESQHNGWIKRVHVPRGGGKSILEFTYYSDGSVASRATGTIDDATGLLVPNSTLYYAYDDAGRLTDVYIDDSAYYDPTGNGEPAWAAGLRVHHVQYTYADDGQPFEVTAYTCASGSETAVAQNTFTYNDLRDLTGETQEHLPDDPNTPTTGSVGYTWQFSPLAAYNFHRLTGITYPARQGQGSGRTVALDYGNNTTDLDSALSRVTKLTDSSLNELAAFTYAGSGRRVARTFGGGTVAQSVAGGGGYAGLDRFGRVIDLHYTGTGGTLQRYQYGYDAAGNRLYARITQVNHDNDRSYLYGYDALNRLILAERGQITPSASGGTIDTGTGAPVPEARLWRLDNLGNWPLTRCGLCPPIASRSNSQGELRRVKGWSGGEVFDPPHDDGTDGSLAWGVDADGGGVPDAGAAWIHHATDRSNRITQIAKDSSATPTTLAYDLAGNLVADGTYFLQYDGFNRLVQVNAIGTASVNDKGEITAGSPGDVVVQFVYDGLGRLIRTVRPDRTEDHYYDGVRRIQTDVTPAVGDPATDRQYVYGPDYVDEFVAQIDSAGAVFYMLQDANYNVVALVGQVAGTWQVVEQYAYRPYGGLVAVDSLGSAPVNTAGHQGLFYERLDGSGLAVGATGFYYNRNRFYSPALGRFLQRDPNETAMPLLTAMAINGRTIESLVDAFSPQAHFRGGMNLYVYLSANPLNRLDPTGLDFNYLSLATTAGVQGMLAGMLTGVINSMNGGSFGEGFAAGFVGGALGGAAGFIANSAFAASASGLWATLTAHALVGAADGAVSAFGQTWYSTGDLGTAFANAAWGAAIGAATGGLVDLGGRGLRMLLKNTPSGAPIILSQKILRQMPRRGWTEEMIEEAVSGGKTFQAVNKATGNSATRFVHPRTGQSVVIDDVTGEVIHVGGPGFLYGPGSGDV